MCCVLEQDTLSSAVGPDLDLTRLTFSSYSILCFSRVIIAIKKDGIYN